MRGRSVLSSLLLVLSFSAGTFATPAERPAAKGTASPLIGRWEGALTREGQVQEVRFDFSVKAPAPGASGPQVFAGSFTAESQGVLEYPFDEVALTANKLHVNLGGGDTVFDGELANGTLSGSFQQEEAKGTFLLRRVPRAPAPYRRFDLEFKNGAVTVAGTLLVPATPGRHPAIVLVNGSKGESRWGRSLFFADRFARRGIAAFVFDKRGVGGSTGDWKTANYEDLAADVVACVRGLQKRADLRPREIGILGHSEGGTIAPLIAARAKDLAFVIAADGNIGPVYRQDLYRVRGGLVAEGYTPEEVNEAMAYYGIWLDFARTGQGWERLEAARPEAEKKRWYSMVEAPPKESWLWSWYRPIGNFDSTPYWETLRAPVLVLWGEHDQIEPREEYLERVDAALRKAGNRDVTELVIPRAEHNLTIVPRPGQPFAWSRVAPGLPELLAAWVRQRVRVGP